MKTAEKIQADYYDKTADKYDEMHLGIQDEHYVALEYISLFMNKWKINSLIDVGCGTGRGVEHLQKDFPNATIKGIEPVRSLIEIAIKKGMSKDVFIEGSGANMPFEDQSFMASSEFGVLHHVADPESVIKEMIRVTKNAIFISDSNRFGQGNVISRLLKLLLWKLGLWKYYNLLRTKGKGYQISEGDGLFYSYSVYDSYNVLRIWADTIICIPIGTEAKGWFSPLLTSPSVLICAFKKEKSK